MTPNFLKNIFCLLFLFSLTSQVLAAVPLDRIVAVVDDSVIMESELEQKMEQFKLEISQRGQQLPPDSQLEKQVLERLILTRLQLDLAAQSRLTVDDEMLNRTISNIAAENQMSLTDFRAAIEKDGFSFDRFRENIREEITLSRLRKQKVDNRIFVSKREIDDHLATDAMQGKNTTEYRVQHILISMPEEADDQAQLATQEKAKFVLQELHAGANFSEIAMKNSDAGNASEGGDLGWLETNALPSLFSTHIPNMEKGEISDLLQFNSGFHIIKLVDKRSSDLHMIEQTLARHILIKPSELITNNEAELRLVNLKERIDSGEDFAELARSHSDDPGSAVQGGELGWSSPGKMVPAFEQQMNDLAPGEISDPFQSQFGWHIVQVLDRREYDGTDEVTRANARATIRKRKSEEDYRSWLIKLRDEAYVEYRL